MIKIIIRYHIVILEESFLKVQRITGKDPY